MITTKTLTTTMIVPLLRTFLCFWVSMGAFGKEVRIKNANEFIKFKNNVNNRNKYEGTTVLLDSDIDLTGQTFVSIGSFLSDSFLGVFDGQGHVINNLEMNSSLQFAGLFGYSTGLTIKNIILDSSCSITNSFIDYDEYTGGIIGYCNGPCTIENSVNMGSVAFSGTIRRDDYSHLHIGGIAGRLYSHNKDSVVRNCANYGSVTHSGKVYSSSIGGIAGNSGSYYSGIYIYNCFNHGTLTHSGTTTHDLHLGGVTGYTERTTIENCVNEGSISSIQTAEYNFIGPIVGYGGYGYTINYCYFTNDLSEYKKYRLGNPDSESNIFSYDSTTFQLSETVSIGDYSGKSLIGVLNAAADYYALRDYSHWLINKGNKDVSFSINGKTSFVLNSQVILLPNLGSEGKLWFDGWYEDSGLTKPLTEYEISSDTELYGRFSENTNNYTITFNTKVEGVFVAPITAPFGSVVTLPSDSIRESYTVARWENVYGDKVDFEFAVPSHDVTLYAVWGHTHIKTPEDFISFSRIVNNGTSYPGTVFSLDSDIDFTGQTFEPIGNSDSNYFSGTFDGQGHVIRNLNATSLSHYIGLFGYSVGLTIKNVILDSSCSITFSNKDPNKVYVGGIIGYCSASYKPCIIENSVNMGSVTFSGKLGGFNLYLGGIVGRLESSYNYDSAVKNCANYGDVTHSGESDLSIGGIAGHSYGFSSKGVYIYNSLNYGTVTHNGTTSSRLYLGGIAGGTDYTAIENCVSGGKISTNDSTCTGSIVGYVKYDTLTSYCYYASELRAYEKYGGMWEGTLSSISNTYEYDTTSFELNETVSIGSYKGNSLIDALNAYSDYYVLRDYSRWLINKERKAATFTINERVPFTLNYQIILLPNLASEGRVSFDVWYEDSNLTLPFTEPEITNDTKLYGRYCGSNYTVILDENGGNKHRSRKVAFVCNDFYGAFPTPIRKGYSFLGWFTKKRGGKKVESGSKVTNLNDHLLYAHWTALSKEMEALIIALTAGVAVIFIAVIAVILFIFRKKRNNGTELRERRFEHSKPLINSSDVPSSPDGYCRAVALSKDEVDGSIPKKNALSNLYPKDYARPTMKEALIEAGYTKKRVKMISSACENAARISTDEGRLLEGFTEEDAAAVAMYTYDLGGDDYENNPCRIINKSLVGRNYAELQKASGLLYLVMTALRKLPRVTGRTLYRGVRSKVSLDKNHYYKGNVVMWPGLSSTSPDMEATKASIGTGTLFIIENGWGYDIQPYSLFPCEEEILLEPEREFEVTGVIEAEGLTIINLQMLDTPLSIPEVSGVSANEKTEPQSPLMFKLLV